MNRITMLSSILFFTGCFEEKDYCTEYVDYMCDCHNDDSDYDCATQQAIYDDTSFEQQTECALSLDEQLVEDDDNGLDCELGSDTGTSDTGV
jgi:hypothetical protein